MKGQAQPLAVYRVLYESMARSRLEAAGSTGWTPLVGREPEVTLLRERWTQVKEGFGQVVLLSGEAGIGKSRLVQVLQAHVATEPQAWLTPCQCSPYYQHTALYPLIELLERVALRFEREEAPPQKLRKLEGFLVQYGLPLAEAVPLLAALLSLPLTADYAPLAGSPEQQKQWTLQTFLTILLRIAAQQPVLFVMEDLHWADPTTLELLSLLIDQGPTARILALCTFRPDFSPPWTGRAHLTQVTLSRLPRQEATEMTGQVAHGKVLPREVIEQVVAKTDGVPLFVEELTKMVLESGLLQEQEDRYELTGPLPPLAIPTTLHDSLMARLDRLATVKALAQLGATLGREFAYTCCRPSRRGMRGPCSEDCTSWSKRSSCTSGGCRRRPPIRSSMRLSRMRPIIACCGARGNSTTSGLPTYWRRSFLRSARRNPSCCPALHQSWTAQSSHRLLAAGGPARARALGEYGSGGASYARAGDAHHPTRHPRACPAGTGDANHPGPSLGGYEGLCIPGGIRVLHPGA